MNGEPSSSVKAGGWYSPNASRLTASVAVFRPNGCILELVNERRRMRMMPRALGLASLLTIAGTASAHNGIVIGRTAGNQLTTWVAVDQPIIIPLSVYPTLPGWTGIDPALNSATSNRPLENFFILDPGMDIEMTLISSSPELGVFTSSGFLQAGQTLRLGVPVFDKHVFWTVPTGIPGEIYSVTLSFRDRNELAEPSDPVTVLFSLEYCAADFNLDGFVDAIDYDRFVEAWLNLDLSADLNKDEFIDAIDLDYFIQHFVGSC